MRGMFKNLISVLLVLLLLLSAASAADDPEIGLNGEERAYLQEHPTLTVGYMNSYLPFSATDRSGEPTGIVKDCVPLLMENLGLPKTPRLRYVGYDDNEEMYAALRGGSIDVAFPVFGDAAYAEEKGAAFTGSIISISIDLAYNGSYSDRTTASVAVNRNNQLQAFYTAYYYPDSEVLYYDTIDACLNAVASGKAGATFLNGLRTSALLSGEYAGKLKAARLPHGVDFGFAVKAENGVLRTILNKAIAATDEAAAFTYSFSYIDAVAPYTAKDFLRDNLMWFLLTVTIFAVVLVVALLMKNQAEKELAEEREDRRKQLEIELSRQARQKQILAKADLGMWAFELDEGRPPRMYADETMLRLLGLKHQAPPEEIWHAWHDGIDADSNGLVEDAVKRMTDGEHAEVQYPWHHPDGHTMIVRCGGVRNPVYTRGVRLEGTHQDVTEVLHLDEEEILLRRRMSMIFALSDEYDPIFVLNPESGAYDWYESRAKEVEEQTSMSIHGKDFYEVIRIDSANLIHEEDRERFRAFYSRENMLRIAGTGEPQETENRWKVGPDGAYLWKFNRAVRMTDENGTAFVVVGVVDTTEAKKKEAEANEQKALLAQQTALSDGLAREYHTVWLLEGSGEHRMHLYRSTGVKTIRAAVQMGLDDPKYDSGIVRYVNDYVHEEDRERVLAEASFAAVERNTPEIGTYVVTYRRYNPEHTACDWHQMCYARAAAADGSVNYIFAYRDADRMMREQIARQDRLQEALAMAQSANRAKTAFLNNMSHDIRTPMNAIIGYTGLAESHIDDRERVRDCLGKIDQSSRHLLSLINDVLDMSRIESGRLNLDEKPENLPDILRALQDIVQADVRAKRHTLSVDMTGVVRGNIVCDRLKLNQILLNILSNSVKYTPDGGTISLCVTEKTAADRRGIYEFRIRDNGTGMDADFLKTIFDPFTRVKSSTVSGIQGTGLGMAITKNLVDMMGGTIDIQSEPGRGTEVTVVLNFMLQEAGEDPDAAVLSSEDYDFRGKKLLLVEDNPLNREIAAELLEEEGFILDCAEDGDIAVEKLRNAKPGDCDLVLMDIQMPRMDGYEAARQIRALGTEISKLPIIAMTANAFEEDRRLALEAGMNEHIAKPIDIARLKAVLAKQLAISSQQLTVSSQQ